MIQLAPRLGEVELGADEGNRPAFDATFTLC